MDKFRKINNFDIQQLNEFHGLTIYDNQLFLNDCIDYRWEAIFKSFPPLPVKMRFTVIFMCVGGEGHALISGNEYSVKENDVIMVSIGNIIETMEVSDDFKAISVAIDPESSLISFTYSSTRFLRDSLYDPKVLHLTPSEGQRMIAFFSTVKNIILQESDMFKSEALQGAYVMLASYLSARLTLLKEHVVEHKVTKWRSNELLRRFLTELSRNYTFERSVQFYARRLFISPKYFAQMIYKESGVRETCERLDPRLCHQGCQDNAQERQLHRPGSQRDLAFREPVFLREIFQGSGRMLSDCLQGACYF